MAKIGTNTSKKLRHILAKLGTYTSDTTLKVHQKNDSSYRGYALGPLCLWQCFNVNSGFFGNCTTDAAFLPKVRVANLAYNKIGQTRDHCLLDILCCWLLCIFKQERGDHCWTIVGTLLEHCWNIVGTAHFSNVYFSNKRDSTIVGYIV